MAYFTLIVAEVPRIGAEIRLTVPSQEIGLLAGCAYPNEDCSNFIDTIVDKHDGEAVKFCNEIMQRLGNQQTILLGSMMNAAVVAESEIVDEGDRAVEYFKLTIRLLG